jgi:hypothetical protein
LAWWTQSYILYFEETDFCVAAATNLAWMACFAVWPLRRIVQRKPRTDPPRLQLDFLCNSAVLHTSMPGNRMREASRRDNSASV